MFKLVLAALLLGAFPAVAKPPRLTLVITMDAVGTDVLLRNRSHFRLGLKTLLDQGAFFPNASYEYNEPVTAAGHTTLATGANPWRHGIVGNRVVNRLTGKSEPIFLDANHPVLEVPLALDDSSPEHILAETLSDRLRFATQGRGKAVAISVKARAAIAQGGRLGQAWWFNDGVGKFVTGTFYAKEFPAWVKGFNARKVPDSYFGKTWQLSLPAAQYLGEDDRAFEGSDVGLGRIFPHPMSAGLLAPGAQARQALESTPAMGDVLVQFARAALDGEQLGKDEVPDLLWVSFSQTDAVYHAYGPYSWEMQDALVRLDKSVGELLLAAEKAAGGKQNLLVVVSADHGGAPIPEEAVVAGLQSARLKPSTLKGNLNRELQKRFGAELALAVDVNRVYLNAKGMADRKLDGADVRRAAAQWLGTQPGIAVAVARDDLDGASELGGYARALRRGYFPERSGDVLLVYKPYVVLEEHDTGANHGSPYAYDTQVPVVFFGKGIRPGLYPAEVHPVDVAPTLAVLLELGMPAQAEGVPLTSALASPVTARP